MIYIFCLLIAMRISRISTTCGPSELTLEQLRCESLPTEAAGPSEHHHLERLRGGGLEYNLRGLRLDHHILAEQALTITNLVLIETKPGTITPVSHALLHRRRVASRLACCESREAASGATFEPRRLRIIVSIVINITITIMISITNINHHYHVYNTGQ